jgi:hypothetical protein
MTGDRILLAENFRRHVERLSAEVAESVEEVGKTDSYHTNRYAKYIQDMVGSNVATSMGSGGINRSESVGSGSDGDKSGPLRLVVISDTHGYEESLTPRGTTLPDGDTLLHSGDFTLDSSIKKKNKAIEKFDAWLLALQPHRTKILLRGNHDPFSVQLPKSGANFFSRPKSIAIDGRLTMTLVPFTSARNLSPSCESWNSH